MLNANSVADLMKAILSSYAMDTAQKCDTLRGSGGYVRAYIFFYMLSYADCLPPVSQLARMTGCTEKQVQAVWDALETRNILLFDTERGCYHIRDFAEAMLRKAQIVQDRDPISRGLALTQEEEADLKRRFGVDYLRMFHRAAKYKANLISRNRPVNLTDYGLVEKAKAWIDKEDMGEEVEELR